MALKRIDHFNFVTQDMEATLHFYCELLGFNNNQKPSFANPQLKDQYLYCDDLDYPLLHILHADSPVTWWGNIGRLAEAAPVDNKGLQTGPLDHICFLRSYDDYDGIKRKLTEAGVEFSTICHDEHQFNQIWVLDPNGIRVEINFNGD